MKEPEESLCVIFMTLLETHGLVQLCSIKNNVVDVVVFPLNSESIFSI